jgi:LEA14-like dessication related protein
LRQIRLIIFLLLALAFGSCSYLKLLTFKIPETRNITRVIYKNVELTKADLIFSVEIINKNDYDLNLVSSEYEVFLEGKYLGKGATDKIQYITRNSINELQFPMTVSLLSAFASGLDVIKIISGNENLTYKADGKAMISFEGIDKQFEVPLHIENKATMYKE